MTDYTSAEFWKGAPELATHVRIGAFGAVDFYMLSPCTDPAPGVYIYDESRKSWAESKHRGGFGSDFIPRPTTPAWNGPQDGLPPVGTVCEYRWSSVEWRGATVFAIKTKQDGGECALVDLDGNDWSWSNHPDQFRPIRTPEQIAEQERELAVERMSLIVGDIETVPTWADALRTLYDAGLRFKEDAE